MTYIYDGFKVETERPEIVGYNGQFDSHVYSYYGFFFMVDKHITDPYLQEILNAYVRAFDSGKFDESQQKYLKQFVAEGKK